MKAFNQDQQSTRSTLISPRYRGSAMTETVLVLPLIFIVLALLFFFGLAMTRLQRSSVTDRYEAWRQAQYAPAPGVEFNKHRRADFGSGGLLNEMFFADNADELDVADRAGRVEVDELVDLIANQTYEEAQAYPVDGYNPSDVEQYVRDLHEHTPAWWRIELSTEHVTNIPLYKQFAGPVKHQHTVIDGDWTFVYWMEQEHRGVHSYINPILRDDVYLVNTKHIYDFRPYAFMGIYYTYYENDTADASLKALEEQGNELAHVIRGIYMNLPDYIGPQVLPEIYPHYLRLNTSCDIDEGQDP